MFMFTLLLCTAGDCSHPSQSVHSVVDLTSLLLISVPSLSVVFYFSLFVYSTSVVEQVVLALNLCMS